MPTRNGNLTGHLDRFVENGIRSGRFSNASEAVREGLRLLEQREKEDQARIEWLRSAAGEGYADIERGDSVSLRSDQEIEDVVDRVRGKRVAGSSRRRGIVIAASARRDLSGGME